MVLAVDDAGILLGGQEARVGQVEQSPEDGGHQTQRHQDDEDPDGRDRPSLGEEDAVEGVEERFDGPHVLPFSRVQKERRLIHILA